MRWLECAAILFVIPGCSANFDETTLVRVARPQDVAVGVQRPHGGEWLLPADGPPARKELPPSKPPIIEGGNYAEVKREKAGNVVLSCPSCKGGQEAHPVPLYADIQLDGEIGDTVRWTPDVLNMRYSHRALFPCYRRPSQDCPREAVALWLQTPRENVIQIRHIKKLQTSYGELTGAKIGLGVGIVADALGLSFLGLFALDKEARQPITPVVAGSFLTVGTVFLVAAIKTLTAENVDQLVYPPTRPVDVKR